MFSLKLFGGAILEGTDGPVGGRLSQRRRLSLLAILALARGRPVSRDRILALLWPESDAERARHSLADSVYQVRKVLGDEAILSVGDDLLLNSAVIASDVQAFGDAWSRSDWESATAHYAGPLLDGFHLDDAAEFERWCDGERDRLARAYASALERLADAAAERGDAKMAVHWCRLLINADPYNASYVLRLMDALERAGDRAGAIQQGRLHAALMQNDVGADADPSILARIEQLKTRPFIRVRPAQPSTVAGDVVRSTAGATRHRRALLPAIVVLVLVVMVGAALAFRGAARSGGVQTIAVLPCANLSNDPGEEYFSDGLTEELIAVLSEVKALRVVARTSVFVYKDRRWDVRDVGRKLNVNAVLECSVRHEQDRMRVTAQLISAADGFHLWAESYDRTGDDLIAIQNDLAIRIVNALETRLTSAERGRVARRATAHPAAYALYLQGQYYWNQRTTLSFERAIDYFTQAIALDSQYARAYSGLARTYSLQGVGGLYSAAEAGERLRQAATRAIELDPDLGEAHAALGLYYNLYAWDTERAEAAYQRAIELDPNYADARHYYANMLRSTGRYNEALRQRQKAAEIDPLSGPITAALGFELIQHGRIQEGERMLLDALAFSAGNWHAAEYLAEYYASINRLDTAIALQRRVVAVAPGDGEPGLAWLLARSGRKDEARMMLSRFVADAQRTGNYSLRVAPIYVALNDLPGALSWVEQAYQHRQPQLRLLAIVTPSLAADARFADLRRRVGLEPGH